MDKATFPPDRSDLSEIGGTVENIIYKNDGNGYTVSEIETPSGEIVTLVGIMPFSAVGESIKALGKWDMHPTFGKQFKVEYYEKELPENEQAMLRYLSSGAIRGVGPVTAKRIIQRFGNDAFDVIENNPEWLADVDGITPKKAKKISEHFRETFGMRSVMMFCRDFFGPALSVKIFRQWGSAAVDLIKANPYLLCEKIDGISFETADKVADSLGADRGSPERISAGIGYFLNYNAGQNGHTFAPRDQLIKGVSRFLGTPEDKVAEQIIADIDGGKLAPVRYGSREVVYLKEYYDAELYAAKKLTALDASCERIPLGDADRFIDQLEAEIGITYARLQREAIVNSINSGVMVLTGGPGTGKTTVIRAVITVFERMGLDIVLAAPTGRAAKRMSEATGHEARTVHRVLETDFTSGAEMKFRRNENDMLDEDVVIVDEASMIDTLLFSALLKAIKPGARLILIGDADQLPSVGAGNVLNDVIDSGRFRTVRLTEIFRQAQTSRIVVNAHEINEGRPPDLSVKNSDFFFVPRDGERAAADTVVDLIKNRLPKAYGEDFAKKIQVITPSHKGATGTEWLNSALQAALNPPEKGKAERKVRSIVFREGDRVMQIRNNYDIEWERGGKDGTGIFNGDIGTVTEIDMIDETLTVDFDGRTAAYDFTQLDELEHAYAITVHKSQGSEYPVVIIPLTPFGSERLSNLMTRNLLYTAVTRATEMVIIVGSRDTVRFMVDNNKHVERYTGLSFLLTT